MQSICRDSKIFIIRENAFEKQIRKKQEPHRNKINENNCRRVGRTGCKKERNDG